MRRFLLILAVVLFAMTAFAAIARAGDGVRR